MADLVGQYLGRYYLTERLGEGGMAFVYKAYDTRLERDVAIKIIRRGAFPADALEGVLKRFEREAKSLAKLSHPNIVKVHDYGEHDGSPYLVMEYLPGGTLKKIIGQPLPWREAMRLLLPIARGVDYAHRHGILHRDIKPANILITDDGEPMLSDFGIAKLLEGEQTSGLTRSGMAIGTPEYMAPEQWAGATTPQSDLYALGIVLYEMLTGRKPYVADTPAAIAIKQATEPLPSPRKFALDLPEALEHVLIKALAKEPGDRYKDVRAFIAALEDLNLRMPLAPNPADAVSNETQKAPPPGPVIPIPTPVVAKDDGKTALAYEKPPTTPPNIPLPDEKISAEVSSESPMRLPRSPVLVAVGVLIFVIIAFAGFKSLQEIVAAPAPSATPALDLQTPSPFPSLTATLLLSSPTVEPSLVPTSVPLPGEMAAVDPEGNQIPMRLVPAGEFTMGSEDGGDDERPVHQVYLDAFYMDKYEVTNALYKACVDAGSCAPPRKTQSFTIPVYYGIPVFEDRPVIYVDWVQAANYCGWRGGGLPTEAQWEKAARGTDGRTYPWGEGIDCSKANYAACNGDTTGVGSYESGVSPYGIYDLAGNVLEWTMDRYSGTYYQDSPASNPVGPDTGNSRVLRGGTWSHLGKDLRASNRYWYTPEYTRDYIGFRCVSAP
jgi:serine/threonine protein kinase